jgi:hypothetical protein
MKDREQILSEGKAYRNFGRLVQELMFVQAVSSSGALISAIPLEFFNKISTPQELAMIVGGLLVAPGSIKSVIMGKKWLDHANQVIADFEASSDINPGDNSKAS